MPQPSEHYKAKLGGLPVHAAGRKSVDFRQMLCICSTQMPQPSEDEKAQFRADFPCALRNAPRLGAVSQFPHSPGRFTIVRPEVEVR